jgi:cyanophycin synthetase
VLCVDKHAEVLAELERLTSSAQAGTHADDLAGDPDLDPAELRVEAEAAGDEAAAAEAVEVDTPTS